MQLFSSTKGIFVKSLDLNVFFKQRVVSSACCTSDACSGDEPVSYIDKRTKNRAHSPVLLVLIVLFKIKRF